MVSRRHVVLLSIYAMAALGGCRETQNMDNSAGSFDSPDVLAVVFHPRSERTSTFASTRGETLTVPVGQDIVVGGRFYAAGTDNPTILFFHGNGEIVADYADVAAVYTGLGINFMPFDYRGYGRSTGQPTVTAMFQDAHAVFDFARAWLKERQYTGRLFVMGRSLGSASALELTAAHTNEVAGLIIDSGFADATALMRRLGWRARKGQMATDTLFHHTEKMAAYTGPTLIIHGTQDTIIPHTDAEALYQASRSNRKQLLRIRGGDHNNLMGVGFDEYFRTVADLVRPDGTPSN